MDSSQLYRRYQDLQRYVDWSQRDAQRVVQLAPLLRPHLAEMVDDFYAEIQRHPAALRVLRGGIAQINRLKLSLTGWLEELLQGAYDRNYVERRWQVGLRHAEIGLDQAYTNVALSRLRHLMTRVLSRQWSGSPQQLGLALESLNRLLDLDLAIIEDAYEAERLKRQQNLERLRMKAALHDEKEFADRLIERAQAMVLVLDLRGNVVRFNPYLEKLTGYGLDELRGRNWFEACVPAEDREQTRQLFLDAVHDIETSGGIHPVVTKDGRRRTMSWSNATLKDFTGETSAVLAIGHDITELQEAQRQLLQSERLAAIGQMITGLAHESRNALQRIQACAEMLELEVEDDVEALDLVNRIQAAQDHVHRLFEEVRGYAAPIQLEREEVRLPEAWREAWELLAEARGARDNKLLEQATGVDLRVEADHFRLVQLFRNLLENAIAACQEPVRITITCSAVQLAHVPAVRIAVRDSGPGLSAQQRARIFEPFYTTKTKGTGLGMSIAQRIVEAHGGRLEVGAETGEGAEFLITLPRAAS